MDNSHSFSFKLFEFTIIFTEPFFVNFIEFEIIFIKTCLILIKSPINISGTSFEITKSNFKSFSFAFCNNIE